MNTAFSDKRIRRFLRGFERQHWDTALENLMVYGIHCLAMNYPVAFTSIQDLKEIVADLPTETLPTRRPQLHSNLRFQLSMLTYNLENWSSMLLNSFGS